MLDKYRYSWYNKSVKDIVFFAAVVELADTRDLKSRGSNPVPVQVRSAAPRRNGLRSIPIFLCRKISHMLRHSSSFAKRHARLACSLVNALTTAHSRYHLFARCAFGAVYCPNVRFLNNVINDNWKQVNIEFVGFVHSHLNNSEISQQDIKYMRNVLAANECINYAILCLAAV